MPDGKAHGKENSEVSGDGAKPGRLGQCTPPRRDIQNWGVGSVGVSVLFRLVLVVCSEPLAWACDS